MELDGVVRFILHFVFLLPFMRVCLSSTGVQGVSVSAGDVEVEEGGGGGGRERSAHVYLPGGEQGSCAILALPDKARRRMPSSFFSRYYYYYFFFFRYDFFL